MEDMGPYKGMPEELAKALARDGTPPVRQFVTIEIANIYQSSFDELPRTPQGFIAWITEQIEKTPKEFRDDLSFILDYNEGYYDSGSSAQLIISYKRAETDKEMIERVKAGLRYLRECEEEEKDMLRRLKKKYGGVEE